MVHLLQSICWTTILACGTFSPRLNVSVVVSDHQASIQLDIASRATIFNLPCRLFIIFLSFRLTQRRIKGGGRVLGALQHPDNWTYVDAGLFHSVD